MNKLLILQWMPLRTFIIKVYNMFVIHMNRMHATLMADAVLTYLIYIEKLLLVKINVISQ